MLWLKEAPAPALEAQAGCAARRRAGRTKARRHSQAGGRAEAPHRRPTELAKAAGRAPRAQAGRARSTLRVLEFSRPPRLDFPFVAPHGRPPVSMRGRNVFGSPSTPPTRSHLGRSSVTAMTACAPSHLRAVSRRGHRAPSLSRPRLASVDGRWRGLDRHHRRHSEVPAAPARGRAQHRRQRPRQFVIPFDSPASCSTSPIPTSATGCWW